MHTYIHTLHNTYIKLCALPLTLSCVPSAASRPVCCAEKTQVTGTGGGEQPDAAPTPTPAPTGAPDPTPAPAAGVGGFVGAIKNAVTGHGSSSGGDTAAVPGASATDEAPPADAAAPGVLGNLTSSISSAAHTVTDAATSTISSAAHTVTGAASGIMGHKKEGDAAVPAAGEEAATEKEGKRMAIACLLPLLFCVNFMLEVRARSPPRTYLRARRK